MDEMEIIPVFLSARQKENVMPDLEVTITEEPTLSQTLKELYEPLMVPKRYLTPLLTADLPSVPLELGPPSDSSAIAFYIDSKNIMEFHFDGRVLVSPDLKPTETAHKVLNILVTAWPGVIDKLLDKRAKLNKLKQKAKVDALPKIQDRD